MDLSYLSIQTVDNAIFLVGMLIVFTAVALFFRMARGVAPPPGVAPSIKLAILGLAVVAIDSLFEAGDFHQLLQGAGRLAMLICLANLIIYLIVDVYLHYRSRTGVASFVRDIITLIVYLLTAIFSLRVVFHIDITSIITTTTVLTATIAFAMQSTITNVLSGFSIQGDRNLRTNTWIAIRDKDVVGRIVNVGFYYTSLRCHDNSVMMVPNNLLMQNIVTSLGAVNDPDSSSSMLDIALGYEIPPEKSRFILAAVLAGETEIHDEPPPLVRIHRFSENAIEYRLRFVLKDYGMRDQVMDRLYSAIWYAITRQGYRFPCPQREITTVKDRRVPFCMNREEIRSELHRLDIFAFLDERETQNLVENARLKVYGPQEIIIREGDTGDTLFVVMRGRLRVQQKGADVGSLQGGEFFGEMSLLTGALRKATVTAMEEVWLLEIGRDVLEPIIRHNPSIMDALSTVLAAREEVNIERVRAHDLRNEAQSRKEETLEILRKLFGL
jgi:small-conductance mechanosensitive channel/CRP-like cAMP-binding protein